MSKASKIINSYYELTKPRIVLMVLITTCVGFVLGSNQGINYTRLFSTLFWSALSCAGVGVLNQYLEREADSLMKRTRNRPIPLGLIAPKAAAIYGILLSVLGTFGLFLYVNLASSILSALTILLYLFVYTPLKQRSWLNTFIGAIPGAFPPLGGWLAANGTLGFGGIVLFLVLFIWQHPHFYAIAWMYREDYQSGGFKMLPVIDPSGKRTIKQVLIYLGILLPVSLTPFFLGEATLVYLLGSLVLYYLYLRAGINFSRDISHKNAVKLLKVSILYLPGILILMMSQVSF
jgi:heme o synthase